jgi:O-antigen ligase
VSGPQASSRSALSESPAARLLAPVALALAAAALVTRGLTSGIGLESDAPGSALLLDAIALSAAGVALGTRLARGEALAWDRGVLAALGAFVASALVSAWRAPDVAHGVRVAVAWAGSIAVGLAARDLARRPGGARVVLAVAVAVVAAAGFLGAWDVLFEWEVRRREFLEGKGDFDPARMPAWLRQAFEFRLADPKASGPFVLPGHLATACASALPLGTVLIVALARRVRGSGAASLAALVGTALATTLAVLGMFYARSRAGLGTAAFVLGATGLLLAREGAWARRRTKLVALAGGLALVALAAIAAVHAARPETFGSVGMSAQVRLEYWRAALSMAADKPTLGQGTDAFGDVYARFKLPRAEETRHAHDDPLEVLAEQGAIGLAAFLASIAALALAARAALARADERVATETSAPEDDLPPARARISLVAGVVLGIVTLLGHGDFYDVRSWEHLLAAGALILVLGGAAHAGLALVDQDPRVARALGAAAVAGALALPVDGLADFPLEVPGLVSLALVLAAAGCGLLRGPEPAPAQPAAARAATAIPIVGLVLWVTFGLAAPALGRDRELARARWAHDQGEVDEAVSVLEPFLDAREPLGIRDVLLLIDAEDARARVRREPSRSADFLDRALLRRPDAFELWTELGARLRARGDAGSLRRATDAFDRAAALYPTDPHRRLEAGLVRVERRAKGDDAASAAEARRELEAALDLARVARITKLHLSDDEIARARAALLDLTREMK